MIEKLAKKFTGVAKESVAESVNESVSIYFPLIAAGVMIGAYFIATHAKPSKTAAQGITYIVVNGMRHPYPLGIPLEVIK